MDIQWFAKELGTNIWLILTPELIVLKKCFVISYTIVHSLTTSRSVPMLDFYGFKLIDKKTGEIDRLSGDSYKSRFHNLNTSSHNYLRITRILKCLGEFGYEYLKFPFLEQILREIIIENTLPNCLQSCKDYWIETLRSRNERHAIRQYARQLVEYRNQGLTSSKSLRAIRPSITKETAAKS
ncbi:unnamed protein product [Rotaria sp. Silwood1]|nr:unnamed protein product [Rotaria sp. Silwood1]